MATWQRSQSEQQFSSQELRSMFMRSESHYDRLDSSYLSNAFCGGTNLG